MSLVTRTALQAKYDQVLDELHRKSKDHVAGWPTDEDCDAALWAGVARAGGATWVDISAAVQLNGRPTRRPYRDCITPTESKTTTSNDMITGIVLGLYASKDRDSLQRLWDYGWAHAWIMGFPEWRLSRVFLRPNGVTLLARSLYRLSDGHVDYSNRHHPLVYGPSNTDYGNHLTLLSRYIQRKVGGPQYGTEWAEQYLAHTAPLDALAQAMAGNSSIAASLLLGNYKSPSYVRGHENYHLAHWLLAARITLDNNHKSWLDKSLSGMLP